MRIVRVAKHEYELEDGSIYPIDPALKEELTIDEFQQIYSKASAAVKSCTDIGGDNTDTENVDR